MYDKRLFRWAIVFFAVLVALVVFLYGCSGGQEETQDVVDQDPPASLKTHDPLGISYTYDGEEIRWYVFVDPDTGEHYLFNDRGGVVYRSGINW